MHDQDGIGLVVERVRIVLVAVGRLVAMLVQFDDDIVLERNDMNVMKLVEAAESHHKKES